jgi:hypothetical protein
VAVQLTASIDNPVDVFRPVFDQAGAVIQGFIATQAANPFPALRQFIANQVESAAILREYGEIVGRSLQVMAMNMPGVLGRGLQKAIAGDPATAFGDVLQGILLPAGSFVTELYRVYTVLQRPVAVLQELVAAAFTRPSNFILAVMTFGIPVIQQVIRSGQLIIGAVTTGDPVNVINAVQHGIADVASKGVAFAGGMLNQIKVIQTILTRAFSVRPPRLPVPTAASAMAALAAAPETQAVAAGQDDTVVATPAPEAVSGEGVAPPVIEAEPAVGVVDAEPVVDVVDPDLEVAVTDAATTEVAADADADSAATDSATTMKDGNMAVPGVVNTGVKGSGTALSKSIESAQAPLKNLGDQVKSALDKVAHGFAKPAGSASGAAGSAAAGSADSGSGAE